MFDIVDTPFSYGRGLILCSSVQEFSKKKESTPRVIRNVDVDILRFYRVDRLLITSGISKKKQSSQRVIWNVNTAFWGQSF